MYLTSKIILHPTPLQAETLKNLATIYKTEVNECLRKFQLNQKIIWIPYSTLDQNLPWESKKEVIKEATKIFRDCIRNKSNATPTRFKGDYCKWHCDSFTLDYKLNLQVGQQSKLSIEFYADDYQKELLSSGCLTSLKIEKKDKKWVCYIKILKSDPQPYGEHVMGVDMGIKVPAVAATSTGKIRFFGNGRKVRYICTSQTSRLSKLMKNNNYRLIRKMDHKWGNRLLTIDHQISKSIIEFAIQEKISTITLENLAYIQKRIDSGKKISTWSYMRLKSFLEYKAQKHGIKIQMINPHNTSKRCPKCNRLNHSSKREYKCACGFKSHRDIVGAINICNYSSSKSN
ncbi:MAG: transposase [Erysipelotrichaceae bacterium]|nr:transposase [Erysipelotrichaceae bacterium]